MTIKRRALQLKTVTITPNATTTFTHVNRLSAPNHSILSPTSQKVDTLLRANKNWGEIFSSAVTFFPFFFSSVMCLKFSIVPFRSFALSQKGGCYFQLWVTIDGHNFVGAHFFAISLRFLFKQFSFCALGYPENQSCCNTI